MSSVDHQKMCHCYSEVSLAAQTYTYTLCCNPPYARKEKMAPAGNEC